MFHYSEAPLSPNRCLPTHEEWRHGKRENWTDSFRYERVAVVVCELLTQKVNHVHNNAGSCAKRAGHHIARARGGFASARMGQGTSSAGRGVWH
mmetsp:Transcript_4803/g.8544  ORF Transcript_4803/g.8544 Transcript_4803/m.8544 type:complete len:94 (-) Transcript_4803:29-310(-)